MSTILFVTWDGGGNVPPALGIAAELVARGHRVRFLGHENNRQQVTDRGLEFVPFTKARSFSCLDENSPIEMMAIFGDRGMGVDLLTEVEREPADVVVIDCLLMGATAAARRAGLRYVALEHLFDEYLRRRWMAGPLGLSGRARGLRPVRGINSASRTLVATLPELDPASRRRQPANLVYTGPALRDPGPQDLSARPPTVLVSLSTYNFGGMARSLQNILDACADLPARVIVTTGPVVDPSDLRPPANAEVHRYVDHDELMPQATLVVGHGGHDASPRARPPARGHADAPDARPAHGGQGCPASGRGTAGQEGRLTRDPAPGHPGAARRRPAPAGRCPARRRRPSHARGGQWCQRDRGPGQERRAAALSAGARSPFPSTTTSSSPSHPAS